ncbi:MAG: hypothetical protein KC502_22990 [Myxococcales bacterium]|nr:hypothetical protein [Myxococcales bacterium]
MPVQRMLIFARPLPRLWAPSLVLLIALLAPDQSLAAKIHTRVQLDCPQGTRRVIRTVKRSRSALGFSGEQGRKLIRCQRSNGVFHGPAIYTRRYTFVAALMRRSYLRGSEVVLFGMLRNGLRDGTWTQLDRRGRELGQVKLVRGTGTWRSWHLSGGISEEGQLKDGAREGPWRYEFIGGEPAKVGSFLRDQKHGVWRWYYLAGGPMRTIAFSRGKRHGLFTSWSLSGNKRQEGRYKQGLRDGPWLHWNKEGILLGINQVSEGDGQWARWFDTGGLQSSGPVRRDKPHGRWRQWYSNGALHSAGDYRDGSRVNGTWQRFDRNSGKSRPAPNIRTVSQGLLGRLSKLNRIGVRSIVKRHGLGGRSVNTPRSRRRANVRTGRAGNGKAGVVRMGTGRAHLTVGAGQVRSVTVGWLSHAKQVRLPQRQSRILRLLIRACARRFRIAATRVGPRPRGGGKPTLSSLLRWKLVVQPNGSVASAKRTMTPNTLTDKGGLKCADYVVSRAKFAPRSSPGTYTVKLSATLIH